MKLERLKVVNDGAERGVAMITTFNDTLTRDDETKQALLQVVEHHSRLHDADHLLERAKLVEEALPDALEQLGVESSADGWRVRSAIVLKSPPVASLLDPAALPILGFVELAQLDLQKVDGATALADC